MTFSTYAPANRPDSLIFRLPPHRFSIATFVIELLIDAARARQERRSIRALARMDRHMLRDLGLEADVLDRMAETSIPAAPRHPF